MGSSHSNSSLDHTAIPSEATQCIVSFLLGVEIVQYTRACPGSVTALNDSLVWAPRLEPWLVTHPNLDQPRLVHRHEPRVPIPTSCCREKAIYLRQRSLMFGGRSSRTWRDRVLSQRSCGDFVPLSYMMMNRMGPHFSLEFNFSLTSGRGSHSEGGILLGFQDVNCTQNLVPTDFFPLISIDAKGGLHLASEKAKPIINVAAQLTFDQWHHLVLSYDSRYLRAYLDGELRFFKRMPRGIPQLPYAQIGTGFGFDPNRTLATYNDERVAWRPFEGLVAVARVWTIAINEHDVKRLARGDVVQMQPIFSSLLDETGDLRRVLTSRPCERYAQILSG